MNDRVIYLYVKESPKGLKYLGITSRNPFKYKGSGVYWNCHLKAHKLRVSDVKTEILFESTSREEIVEKGTYYSKLWNIVDSDEWANLVIEDGYGGSAGQKVSEAQRKAISAANKGRILTPEQRERQTGFLLEYLSTHSHPSIGIKQTPEHIAKRVAKNTGRKHSEETKKTQSEKAMGNKRWEGKHHSEETKKKLSDALKGKKTWSTEPKTILNTETGIFYIGVKAAAETIGQRTNTLTRRLSGIMKNNTSFIYI